MNFKKLQFWIPLIVISVMLTDCWRTRSSRILLIISVAHIGSLRRLFRDDEAYELIDIQSFLN